MKRCLIFLFILFALSEAIYSQIAITELSYNPPESGTDSLEYIELYNHTNAAVNLQGYRFTRGVDLIFPDVVIPAQGYLLLSGKASAIQAIYGLPSLQWTSGALNNGGERITIVNAQNAVIVDFTYATTAPWPTSADGTNGEGRSIELCHPLADANNGANWKVSENDLGFQINGKQVYGTPAAANSIPPCGPEADVTVTLGTNTFTPRDITINVGQTVRWDNPAGNHNINGTQATYPNNPVSFGNGAVAAGPWTYDFTFNVPGSYQYQSDAAVASGMTGTVTVIDNTSPDLYPRRTIAQMRSVNADGVADSLDVKCTLRGIVYGINYRTTGLQFTIIDGTGKGIGAFSSSSTFGYIVTEGDEVDIKGSISQFNGLTQMTLDDVIKISTGNPLLAPKVVTQFVEDDESSFLMIQNVSFADPSQWTGAGAGFNVTTTNGVSNFSVRIDNDSDAYSATIPGSPTGIFNVTGILGQFDNTLPYTEGYQLFIRYLTDFAAVLSTKDGSRTLTLIPVPNPVCDYVRMEGLDLMDEAVIFDSKGHAVAQFRNSSVLDFSGLTPGVYVVKIIYGIFSGTVRIVKI